MEENKIVETRVLSFTEETYEDGTQIMAVKADDFSDFELIGILKYYLDVFTASVLQGNIKK